MIEAKAVTKTYGKKQNVFRALADVSLKVDNGTVIAIVGKSGSGKSTLLHILTGLDAASKGEVLFDGQNIIKDMDTDTWRGTHVGIVFQQFFLQTNDTVLDNVALPLKIQGVARKKRRAMALEALEKVGIKDKATSKANDLSGGQKQRVAIARAIVTNPSLLIADEPTGNLDSENGEKVERLLFDLNKKFGTTLVIVTHDEDLARRCHRIVRLHDGRIKEDVRLTKNAEAK